MCISVIWQFKALKYIIYIWFYGNNNNNIHVFTYLLNKET